MSSEPLISPPLLFRWSVPCLKSTQAWSKSGIELGPEHQIPSFHAELAGGPQFAELRVAWNNEGLLLNLRVTGKKQALWCRDSRLDDSDGLSLWIATRDIQNIHRASRFCHRFIFLPAGGGELLANPIAQLVAINRSREDPKAIPRGTLKIRSEKRVDGYLLQAWIPAAALTGFDPQEHPRMGIYYAITDRELGWQTFSLGAEYPFASDPSLWGSLELAGA
jgi:hypothetical protein